MDFMAFLFNECLLFSVFSNPVHVDFVSCHAFPTLGWSARFSTIRKFK